VALIQTGRLIAFDTPDAIARSFDRPLFAVRTADRRAALNALRSFPYVHSVFPFGDVHHVTDQRRDLSPETIAAELRAFLAGSGLDDADVAPTAPSVVEVFIAWMGAPPAPVPEAPLNGVPYERER
jgi:hypothetical protein